jgi:hypothetical protein
MSLKPWLPIHGFIQLTSYHSDHALPTVVSDWLKYESLDPRNLQVLRLRYVPNMSKYQDVASHPYRTED